MKKLLTYMHKITLCFRKLRRNQDNDGDDMMMKRFLDQLFLLGLKQDDSPHGKNVYPFRTSFLVSVNSVKLSEIVFFVLFVCF